MHHDVKVRQYLLLPGPPLLPALTTSTGRKLSLFAVGGTRHAHRAPGSSPPSSSSTLMLRPTHSYPTPWEASRDGPTGFESPTFDDSARASAVSFGPHNVGEHPAPLLRKAFTTHPCRRVAHAHRDHRAQPGVHVVAFERVVAGWEKISVQGLAKKMITIHFGEKLNTNGTVEYQDILNNFLEQLPHGPLLATGAGERETFAPKFSYKGYQYH
ncbi:hypothetical protein B0H13DRAFT_2314244 [Mycena leptocephala]|nr:hypothetical protein B0H13DRAFT_2314244 [Mycena leptocephala]